MEVIVKSTENSLPEVKASSEFSWPHLYFQPIQKILFQFQSTYNFGKRVIRRPGTSPGKLVTHL